MYTQVKVQSGQPLAGKISGLDTGARWAGVMMMMRTEKMAVMTTPTLTPMTMTMTVTVTVTFDQ